MSNHPKTSCRVALALAATLVLGAVQACSPCKDVSRTYATDLSRYLDAPAPSRRDDLVIGLSQPLLTRANEAIADRFNQLLQDAIPGSVEIPLISSQLRVHRQGRLESVIPYDAGDGLGVRVALGVYLETSVPSISTDLTVGVFGRVEVDAVVESRRQGDGSELVLRLARSRLVSVEVEPAGVIRGAAFAGRVADWLEQAARSAMRTEVLRQIGDVAFMRIDPIEIEGSVVAAAVNRLGFDAQRMRLEVGLSVDLPATGAYTMPEPGYGDDIEVRVASSAGQALLNAVLAEGAGRRFDGQGGQDTGGAYRIMVTDLRPDRGRVDFAYRLYRSARPCLIADFAGQARVGMDQGRPSLVVDSHRLVDATRYRDAVEARQPEPEALSRALTRLLTKSLAFDVVRLPLLGDTPVDLTSLSIEGDGYRIGWRLR